MNKEEKEVEKQPGDASTEQNKEVETKEKENSGQNASADQKTEKESEIDYAAELEKEKKAREGAEKKIVDLKRQLKNAPKEDIEDEDEEEDVEDIVDRKVNERLSSIKADLVSATVEEELELASSNPAERELIRFHYENTLKQSGSSRAQIRADLEKAKLLANSSKYAKENAELKESLKAKKSISNAGEGANNDKQEPEAEDIQLSEADRVLLARRNLTIKDVKKNIQNQ